MTIKGSGTVLTLVAAAVALVMIVFSGVMIEYLYNIRPCTKQCDHFQATRIYGICHCKLQGNQGWVAAEHLNKVLPPLPEKKKRKKR